VAVGWWKIALISVRSWKKAKVAIRVAGKKRKVAVERKKWKMAVKVALSDDSDKCVQHYR
jgi:hypothetical protein